MRISAVCSIFLSARQLHKHTYHIYMQNKKTGAHEINDRKAVFLKKTSRSRPFTLQVSVFLSLAEGPLASELLRVF